jgi:hypothetical protein
MKTILLSLLLAAPLAGGCFSHVRPVFAGAPVVNSQAKLPGKPPIAVQVSWAPEDMHPVYGSPDLVVGRTSVFLAPAILPFFIGGREYVADPSEMIQAYRVALTQELEALGFRTDNARDASFSLDVKLVHAHYDWDFILILLFPIVGEAPGGVTVAGTAQLTTPAAVATRNFKVMEEDTSIPPRERFARAWRAHAAEVASAVAERCLAEGRKP